tara:strand:+ start:604 stop:1071 length:468 start_codon:yes stop_codon:yes gene_type:complete
MNNISEEELFALQAHVEVEPFRWQKLQSRIFIRAGIVMVLILCKLVLLKFYHHNFVPLVLDGAGLDAAEVQALISGRVIVGATLSSFYVYALMTNRYLRAVSFVALMVSIALIWADLQMFLVSSFPDFTMLASVVFGLRLIVIYLLALNYLDIRR